MNLRPYQREAITRARSAYAAGARGVVIVAPTGAGKTVIAAEVVRLTIAKGGRVLIVVPRREIVAQTVGKLRGVGLSPQVVAAGQDTDGDRRVVVAMAQTLVRRRADCIEAPTLVIIDEAHLAVADTYARILERWPRARHMLLTATPCRTDGRGLGEIAQALVEVASVRELVAQGHLVPPVVYSAEAPDLTGIRKTAGGELSPSKAGARYQVSVIMGDTLDQIRQRCAGRRVLVFASSVEHSRALVESLRAEGYKAEHIDGGTRAAERAETLAKLADGSIDVVCNYGCLCEGLDVPAIGAIVVARSTQSEALWRQMVGRGLRPFDDKRDCIVIDQGGNAHRHGHPLAGRLWTLEGRAKRESNAATCRTCPECLAIYEPAPACPRCGARHVAPERKGPRELKRTELRLVAPGPDGKPKPIRAAPDGWRDDQTWEAIERERIAGGYHWRWSLHRLQQAGWSGSRKYRLTSCWR